jgi:N-acetyltransferase 10
MYRRYAINDSTADWGNAEAQVANIAKAGARPGSGKAATIVSVKSTAPVMGQKRKAVADTDKEGGGTDKKATRRGGKKVKR